MSQKQSCLKKAGTTFSHPINAEATSLSEISANSSAFADYLSNCSLGKYSSESTFRDFECCELFL